MPPRSVTRARSTPTTAQKAKGLTHLQSLNVIRNMIRVSISEICYLRNLFPEEQFKERVYADMNVKCLAPMKETSSQETDDALLITMWLEDGVFEALEKKYLESLVLCIYSISAKQQPEHLLESYTYTVKHASNGSPELSTSFTGAKSLDCSAENVKAQTIQLIRSLVSITNNLDPLPRSRMITMKIFFNDKCPSDWQPKHFKTATSEYSNQVKAPSLKLDVGRVITPHHLVTMELEMAEECMESLSQVGSQHGISQSCDQPDDESDATTLNDEQIGTPGPAPSTPSRDTLTRSEDGLDDDPVQVTPTQKMTNNEFMVFLVGSSTVDKHSITKRFHAESSSRIDTLLAKFEEAGMLQASKVTGSYNVMVHDSTLFDRAINAVHGKLKRQITVEGLAHAMGINETLAEALLVRMGQEKLVDRAEAGFNVLFSESTRPLIRKALQTIKAQTTTTTEHPPAPVEESSGVYDFEPGECITPANRPKRKSAMSSAASSVASSMAFSQRSVVSQGSCANVPILQVRKALKKRKLALKHVS